MPRKVADLPVIFTLDGVLAREREYNAVFWVRSDWTLVRPEKMTPQQRGQAIAYIVRELRSEAKRNLPQYEKHLKELQELIAKGETTDWRGADIAPIKKLYEDQCAKYAEVLEDPRKYVLSKSKILNRMAELNGETNE